MSGEQYELKIVTITGKAVQVLEPEQTMLFYYRHNNRAVSMFAYLKDKALAKSLAEYEGKTVTITGDTLIDTTTGDVVSLEVRQLHTDGAEADIFVTPRGLPQGRVDLREHELINEEA